MFYKKEVYDGLMGILGFSSFLKSLHETHHATQVPPHQPHGALGWAWQRSGAEFRENAASQAVLPPRTSQPEALAGEGCTTASLGVCSPQGLGAPQGPGRRWDPLPREV